MTEDNANSIPEMNLDKYSLKKPLPAEIPERNKKEMDKVKEKLEKIQKYIIKKYPFTEAIGILPPQAIKIFVEEENLDQLFPKEIEEIKKAIHLYMVIPEDKLKETPKIKEDLVKEIQKEKQNVWVHVKTPVDIWESCLDSKFDVFSAIAMSFPLFDKGILGAIRVAEIHRSLVLQKFEKYVVSYVIAGSLVRGEATPTSDIDVFIVINDTDVKRMPRLELKERLRSIIYQYIGEAEALAGVKNKLSPQVYLLTDFWEAVKDAHPVMFTFIRDGIPIHDRGTFMPWKSLLKMGKLKPSPEAIDMFMRTAEKTKEIVDRRLVDAMIDIYYGVLTPSQALIMLYGEPPPTPKETAKRVEEIFVVKEKMLKKSEIAILEKAVKEFKAYEHDPKYTIQGKEIDSMIKDSEDYMKILKELREKIEKRVQENLIEQIYGDAFRLIEAVVGKMSHEKMIDEFNKLVKNGVFTPVSARTLNNLVSARKEFKKGKLSSHKVHEIRKDASILLNDLMEYNQRKEIALEKEKRK